MLAPPSLGFPCGSAGKESACNQGDLGSIPGLGRSPGEGKGYPLQYSGLENSMDCIVYGVAKSWALLSDFHFVFKFNKSEIEYFMLYSYLFFCLLLYLYLAAAAAAAAKSLQSCPTLCDSRDGSPPGSPVPGLLQARTLEWVAVSFSNV